MSNWTEEIIEKVWKKGEIVKSFTKEKYRKDIAGAWMVRSEYGNQDSIYGWQIDHKIPSAKKGSHSICNLQPMQWNNNQTKDDNFPSFETSITSKEKSNIVKTQSWKYNNQSITELKLCTPKANV
jgi:hypothetical protein